MKHWLMAIITGTAMLSDPAARASDKPLELNLRSRNRTADGFALNERKVAWEAKRTALIICDMWDDHWSEVHQCGTARRIGLAG